MAKARRSTGCKLIQTFDDGSTVEQDFGDCLTDYTLDSSLQSRYDVAEAREYQRKVTTLIFRTPWEACGEES